MNSLFFWIIVLSFVVPTALRLYRKSVRRRNQDRGMPGGFPNELGGGYPGQFPGGYPGQFPGQDKQPRDGYTQQDYFSGGFRQAGGPGRPVTPDQQGYGAPVPYEDSPGYLNSPPVSGQRPAGQPSAGQPSAPAVPPPPSGPQGYRARKLAELDQRYSNGELAMEDYMAQRAEIMKG
ncbi:hypothetical protein [Pseudarthrobacter albicanus]|uniref:hypothetical protein n=1 Tax=Pseudarthrobacter albicanus TaxID=2823873 RepID=UPI001BA5EA15|nr:hypothetical protein [Pseudarthrobacter albicanus]